MTGPVRSWPPPELRGSRAVVFANGSPEPSDFVRAVVRAGDALLAADGGACQAMAAGLLPHLVVGDFDSLPAADLAWLEARTAVWRHPAEKDASDLELALEAALALEPREILVLGALGGRLDHLLTNIGLLHRVHEHGTPARLLGAQGGAVLVAGECSLALPVGTLVSLLPLSARVTGVTLRGLRYPLQDATLAWGTSRGLSNVAVASPIGVEARQGTLLLMWHFVGSPDAWKETLE